MCLHSLIETLEGLGKFLTVIHNLDFIAGLHNCLEFSQPLACLYQAMQTQKKRFLLLKSRLNSIEELRCICEILSVFIMFIVMLFNKENSTLFKLFNANLYCIKNYVKSTMNEW